MKESKSKLLCILHLSPPAHGAARVGDTIKESLLLKEYFDVHFIKIHSSDSIGDIGRVQIKKIFYFIQLFFKVLWALVIYRPKIIYFTASVKGIAFYRDYLVSFLWRGYRYLFKNTRIYYHYHTSGICENAFISEKRLKRTRRFFKDTNLILLSPLLENKIEELGSYRSLKFLPNGVKDPFRNESFESYINNKYESGLKQINILFLSNMIKGKGYFDVLELARRVNQEKIIFHFAGTWQNETEEKAFFDYIEKNKLNNIVFHGFVSGEEKNRLLLDTHLFILPSRIDAFPLVLLEALSYGIPCISTKTGAIPSIIDEKSGILVDSLDEFDNEIDDLITNLINIETSLYCRNRYLDLFSVDSFEKKLVEILHE